MSGIAPGDPDESVDLDVARAQVAKAEAEMKAAEARLRLAEAGAQRERPRATTVTVRREGKTSGDARRWRRPSARVAGAVAVLLAVVCAGTAFAVQHAGGTDRGAGGLANGVALRVDGVTVSEATLARRLQVLQVLYGIEVPTSGPELAQLQRETARSLATSLVIDKAAQDRDLAVDTTEVSAALQRYLRTRYPRDQQEAFAAELAKRGITEQDVRDEIGRQLDGQRLFDKVTAGIAVTDADVRTAYTADPAAWRQPERRMLRFIAVADLTTARKVLADLRGGADFAAQARRSSADSSTKDVGGELGLVTADQLDPAFARTAFAARRGALFGPVETSRGWYVGQVQRIVAARSSYADLRGSIKQGLTSDRALAAWNAFVDQATRAARIVYAPRFRPSATTPGSQAPSPTPQIPVPSDPATAPSPGE